MALYYLDFEKPIAEIDKRIEELRTFSYHPPPKVAEEIASLEAQRQKILAKVYGNLTRWQRTQLSRHFSRPTFLDYHACGQGAWCGERGGAARQLWSAH